MAVATGSRSVGDVVTLFTDSRWQVYTGTVPETGTFPAVVVSLDVPIVAAQGACIEDQGQIRSRWRINGYASSVDQARWLQGQCAAVAVPDMMLESVGPIVLDPTEQPDLYGWSMVFRDFRVVDA